MGIAAKDGGVMTDQTKAIGEQDEWMKEAERLLSVYEGSVTTSEIHYHEKGEREYADVRREELEAREKLIAHLRLRSDSAAPPARPPQTMNGCTFTPCAACVDSGNGKFKCTGFCYPLVSAAPAPEAQTDDALLRQALDFINSNAQHADLCEVFNLDDDDRHMACTCGFDSLCAALRSRLASPPQRVLTAEQINAAFARALEIDKANQKSGGA